MGQPSSWRLKSERYPGAVRVGKLKGHEGGYQSDGNVLIF